MKFLILAIVLCAVESQARGVDYNGRQWYRGYNRRGDQQVHHEPVTGAQVMSFVIRTLERLQSLYAANKWTDLYQYPDLSLPLPSTYQNQWRSNQAHDMDGQGPTEDPNLTVWSRRREPVKDSGIPTRRPTFAPPPPPPPPPPPRG